jgi:hypothetical protein
MPLLDHFRPPISEHHRWESFHSNWATRIADALNEVLPDDFLAEEQTHSGKLEIDIATYELSGQHGNSRNGGVALAEPSTWAPPSETILAIFPDSFEVKVFSQSGGQTLVGVIELVSPSNKDRPEERRAFASKAASYLHQGISLIIVDVVTSRSANLHRETLRQIDPAANPAVSDLYAVAYRPVLRKDKPEIDLWYEPLALGEPLPTLPLRLTGDLIVPVELEASYSEACARSRIA